MVWTVMGFDQLCQRGDQLRKLLSDAARLLSLQASPKQHFVMFQTSPHRERVFSWADADADNLKPLWGKQGSMVQGGPQSQGGQEQKCKLLLPWANLDCYSAVQMASPSCKIWQVVLTQPFSRWLHYLHESFAICFSLQACGQGALKLCLCLHAFSP